MRRGRRIRLAALLCAALGLAGPAAAVELTTTIDLDYTYTQENDADDVRATTEYKQKYEVKYQTALTSAFDFIGAVRLELEDLWATNEAGTSRVAPTLELEATGAQAKFKIAYEGVVDTTDAYHESGETKTYSTSLTADAQLTPEFWPETKVKIQRKRDYEPWTSDGTTDLFELTLLKDLADLRLEFSLKLEDQADVLPETASSSSIDWSGKATHKAVLWGGTEFELAYEIKENYAEDELRGVFVGLTESYTQQLKTRVKNTLDLTTRMRLALSWEYQFEQDLLALDFDYKVKNKFLADLKWELSPFVKLAAEAQREFDHTAAVPGADDERGLSDTLKAGFDIAPSQLLRLSGKAELKMDSDIGDATGGSVDRLREEKFELAAKNSFGGFWDLSLTMSSSTKREDDWIVNAETKFKGEAKIKLGGLLVTPTYEATRTDTWESGFDDPDTQKQVRDGRLKFEYKAELAGLLAATFSHEYGIKVEDALDAVLNFERTLQLTENTKLNLRLAEIVRDLKIEGEVERKGSDTEDDPDPELVEVSWALKLDWKFDELSLSSSVKYNDKGDTYDDVTFNSKVGWKGERLELTGEYQFEKVYAELTEEERKLNLKLNYKF